MILIVVKIIRNNTINVYSTLLHNSSISDILLSIEALWPLVSWLVRAKTFKGSKQQ